MSGSLPSLLPFAGAYVITLNSDDKDQAPFVIYSDGTVYVAGIEAEGLAFDSSTNVLTVPSITINGTTVTNASLTLQAGSPPNLPTFQGTATADGQQIGFAGSCLVALPAPTLAASANAGGLFSQGLQFTMQDVLGNNVCLDSHQRLYVRADPAATFTVTLQNGNLYLAIGSHYLVSKDNYIYATASNPNDATPFSISALLSGYAVVSLTQGGETLYWQDVSGSMIQPQAHQNLNQAIQFSILVSNAPSGAELYPEPEMALTSCQVAWVGLLWQLTGGLFLALGIGPYMVSGEAKSGLYNLLMSNRTVAALAQQVVNAAKSDEGVTAVLAVIPAFLDGVYQQGLLWPVVKFVLSQLGWYALFRVVSKILEVVLLPEVEAADLLASFTVWAVQTVAAGVTVGTSCSNDSNVAGKYVPALA